MCLELVVIKYLERQTDDEIVAENKNCLVVTEPGSHVNTEGRAAAPATNMAALVGWEASQARNIKTDLGCLGVTTGGQVVRSSR